MFRYLFLFAALIFALEGCGMRSQHMIVIQDAALAPNLSLQPAAMTLKAGEEVAWVNHTNNVLKLNVWEGSQDRAGLLRKLGSKIGLGAGGREEDRSDRIKTLEEVLKEQQAQLAELKSQLDSTPEDPKRLQEKLDLLTAKLEDQQAQLAALQNQPAKEPDIHHLSTFIPSYSRISSKFEQPGNYHYSLFQTSANRRASQIQGTLTVLP